MTVRLSTQYLNLDDLLTIEGDHDTFGGTMRGQYSDQQEEVKRWTDEWFEKHLFEAIVTGSYV